MLRLHTQGTLRTIALKDIREFEKLEQELDHIERRISKPYIYLNFLPFLSLPIMRWLPLPDSLGKIGVALAGVDKNITGSLLYRVSQSQQYVAQFQSYIESKKIYRVEGWEPYDEFVTRRLFQQFRRIQNIGDRYKSIQKQIATKTRLNGNAIMLAMTFTILLFTANEVMDDAIWDTLKQWWQL